MKKMLIQGTIGVLMMAAAGATMAADVEAGKAKAAACAGCHGANFQGMPPTFPSLVGKDTEYLTAQLKAFKSGERDNAIMKNMVVGLSDQDMANISAYLSSLPAE